jgi:hypothetical protein
MQPRRPMKNHILPFLLSALALTLGCVATGPTEPDEPTLDTTRTEVPTPSRAPAITAGPTHTAQGDAVELASRVDPDLEIARRVAIQLASSPSGFTQQGCGVGLCLLTGGLQAGGPNDEESCGTATCCIAQDQCGVLTDAACQQFCAQNGMPLPALWLCNGGRALCLCCHP